MTGDSAARGWPYGRLRPIVEADKAYRRKPARRTGQIVAGLKPGRENDEETILFWHRGLSTNDIALGHAMLEKAAKLGIGQKLRYR